jgi:tRNA threonylcarbamoyladenosine biosynthesis protein TsaE
MTEFTRTLPTEADTLALGRALAPCLVPGLTIYLIGELGAGKTTLARGLLRGLGYAGKVKSPTFTLVEVYEVSRLYLYHFDFYRFSDPGVFQPAIGVSRGVAGTFEPGGRVAGGGFTDRFGSGGFGEKGIDLR